MLFKNDRGFCLINTQPRDVMLCSHVFLQVKFFEIVLTEKWVIFIRKKCKTPGASFGDGD